MILIAAVRLEQIRCPLLIITASADHIVPGPTAIPLGERCGSSDVTHTELPGGHVGIVVGSGASRHLWPLLDQWLLPRSRPGRVEDQPSTSAAVVGGEG